MAPEDRAYAENKGWKADVDPAAIFQSYQNLERMFGADKAGRTVVLPKDESDTEAAVALYTRLGRPETPDGYTIELPPDADTEVADAARAWFHKANLTTTQAKAVTEQYRALELDRVQRVQKEHEAQVAGLEKEWGADFAHKAEVAKAAVSAAGVTQDQVRQLELVLGPAAAAKIFHFFGQNYVEGSPPGQAARPAGGFSSISPGDAKAKIDGLFGDKAFMERYNHQDPNVRAGAMTEMENLSRVAIKAQMG